MYGRMRDYFGDPGWWPGDTPFEVMVGAILTQSASWDNVVRAIDNLKREGLMDPVSISSSPKDLIEALIRPSGFYRQKAERLKRFCSYLVERYGGDVGNMKERDMWELREELLSLKGIGKETCDSILLYALEKPIFVVDAYTHRILNRHGFIPEDATYDEIQEMFMNSLPRDTRLFNEFHALFVLTGKSFCRKTPRCKGCPLEELLP